MHSVNLILLLGVITTVECIELFHYPIAEIHNARVLCTQDANVSSDCYYSCALEKTNMLTPQFDGVSVKEFGYFYKKYADDCWKSLGITAKPTCGEAEKFVNCFYNGSKLADQETMKECTEKFPVKDLNTVAMTPEELAKNNNLACIAACLADRVHAFLDDGSFNLSCINPHLGFEFKGAEAAKKCEEDNKQTNKCERIANRYLCMIRTFEQANSEYYRQSELKSK